LHIRKCRMPSSQDCWSLSRRYSHACLVFSRSY